MLGKGGDLQTLFQSLKYTIIVAAIMILIGDDIRMVMIENDDNKNYNIFKHK